MNGLNSIDGGHFVDSAGRRRSKRIVALAAKNHRCEHVTVIRRPPQPKRPKQPKKPQPSRPSSQPQPSRPSSQPQPSQPQPQPNDGSPEPAEMANTSSGIIARPHRGPRFVRAKPYECAACMKRFASTGELAKHALSEHKPSRRQLRDHGTPGRKPYQCELCPASFDRDWLLASHAERFHPLCRRCVNAMCAAISNTPVVWPNQLPSISVPVVPRPSVSVPVVPRPSVSVPVVPRPSVSVPVVPRPSDQ